MKFMVMVNVSINPYLDDSDDRPSYSQSLYFNDKIDIEADNWTDTGTKIDALVGAVKEALHGKRD